MFWGEVVRGRHLISRLRATASPQGEAKGSSRVRLRVGGTPHQSPVGDSFPSRGSQRMFWGEVERGGTPHQSLRRQLSTHRTSPSACSGRLICTKQSTGLFRTKRSTSRASPLRLPSRGSQRIAGSVIVRCCFGRSLYDAFSSIPGRGLRRHLGDQSRFWTRLWSHFLERMRGTPMMALTRSSEQTHR